MGKLFNSFKIYLIALSMISAPVAIFDSPAYSFNNSFVNQAEKNVYICSSPKAYAFHKSKTCSGLNRCSYEVKEITKSDATTKLKRSACKICY
jgi:hypothetical protein